jgi:phosphoglucomutase
MGVEWTMTMTAVQRYQAWLNDETIDSSTKLELESILGNDKEIEDRFFRDLEFGTGGLRGVIGAGTNRMNRYTVGKATQGLANYLLDSGIEPLGVVIAHDSRHQSPEFALETALVFAANGIRAYVFDSLRPTPELSFAVRELGASAGIVITASHNPPEYNGYKVYGPDGGQLVPDVAEQVIERISKIPAFSSIRRMSRGEAEAEGFLHWIGHAIDEKYITAVSGVSQHPEVVREMGDRFKVVFTPLHGSGNMPVRRVLERVGFSHVIIVPEQELPDPNFSTVKSPNPEEREAFTLAIELAKSHQADLIIGTDPDCDRVGAVVKNSSGEFVVLNGNQSGAIMVHYFLSSLKQKGSLPVNGKVIKTIVTSEMGAMIAQSFGIETLNTLTGFKYIGEKMTEFERSGDGQFLFGYEESYGYLAGTYARDKDAVLASMLICEAAAYYKSQGKTLYDVLQELYEAHGYFQESLVSRTLKGKDGIEKIGAIMENWRSAPPQTIEGIPVKQVLDYSQGLDGLPKENVLKYILEDGSWFCLRPSGTEPKIKVYFAVQGTSEQQASQHIAKLSQSVMERVDQI